MRKLTLVLLICCVSAAWAGDGPGRTGDAIKTDVDAILSRPEYGRWNTRSAPDADHSWLRTLSDWLTPEEKRPEPTPQPEERRVERRTPRMSGSGATASSLFEITGYVFMIAAALFLVYALVEGYREPKGEEAAEGGDSGVGIAWALAEGNATAFDDKTWRREAERLLEKGEIRQAYRSLYLSLLSGLHGQGRIIFARNRTNWHYVRQFRGESGERGEFSAMTGLFDEVWYGLHDAISGQGLSDLRLRVEKLLRAGEGGRGV